MTKKLYKSDTNKVLSGVIGGLGEYFEIDPVLLRLSYLLVVVLTGVFPGIVAYIIAVIIVPKKPLFREAEEVRTNTEQTQNSEK